jgi:hypothetical protein
MTQQKDLSDPIATKEIEAVRRMQGAFIDKLSEAFAENGRSASIRAMSEASCMNYSTLNRAANRGGLMPMDSFFMMLKCLADKRGKDIIIRVRHNKEAIK